MKKALKYGLVALVVTVTGILAFAWTPDISPDTLIVKYGGSRSNFANLPSGANMHFRYQGNLQGPLVVLLHGSNSSLHTWEPWIKELGDRFALLTLDLPGHGLTGAVPDDDYTYAGMVKYLHELLSHLGHTRFFLGGNSMGGGIALAYAHTYPKEVQGLLLLDAAGVPLPETTERTTNRPLAFRLAGRWYANWILENITPRSLAAEGLKKSFSNQGIITEDMIDRYWELVRFPGNRHATGLRFASYRNRDNAFVPLEDIQAPSLIIWGRDDNLIPVATADVLDEKLVNSRVVIYDNVGHLPMEETPADSAHEARTFMEAVLTTSGGAKP